MNKKKLGLTLTEVLIALVIMGVFVISLIPAISVRKKAQDYELSTITCIKNDNGVTTTTACENSIKKCRFSQDKACETLEYLAYYGSNATEKKNSRAIIKEACTLGGEQACNIIISMCQKDINACDFDTTNDENDLRYFMELLPGDNALVDNEATKFIISDLVKPLYKAGQANIVSAIDSYCCSTGLNMACYTKGVTDCP